MKVKILSFHNQKGGCGKSTLTALVANSLSQDCNKKVLVIDADMQYSINGIREDIKAKLGKDFIFSYDFEKSSINSCLEIIKEKYKKYDVILVDLPGLLTISPTDQDKITKLLNSCDIIICPVKPDVFDIKSSIVYYKSIEVLQNKKRKLNGDIDLYCVVNQKNNNKISSMIKTVLEKNKLKSFNTELSQLEDYAQLKLSDKSILKSPTQNSKTKREFTAFIEEIEELINN